MTRVVQNAPVALFGDVRAPLRAYAPGCLERHRAFHRQRQRSGLSRKGLHVPKSQWGQTALMFITLATCSRYCGHLLRSITSWGQQRSPMDLSSDDWQDGWRIDSSKSVAVALRAANVCLDRDVWRRSPWQVSYSVPPNPPRNVLNAAAAGPRTLAPGGRMPAE
jgi:hypothetical protein